MKFNIKVILFFNQLLNYFAVFSPVCSIPFVDRVLTKLDLSSSNQFRLNANRLALFSKHSAQTLKIMLPMKLNDLLVVPRHRGRKSVKSKLFIAKKNCSFPHLFLIHSWSPKSLLCRDTGMHCLRLSIGLRFGKGLSHMDWNATQELKNQTTQGK